MTAEFAVVLPAVLLVLTLCVGAVQLAVQQVRLTSFAASAARMLARGDAEPVVRSRLDASLPAASLAVQRDDGFECVAIEQSVRLGPVSLGRLALAARSCALGP